MMPDRCLYVHLNAQKYHQGLSTHASRCSSGTLASTFLISPGPNPVTVLLCFGLVIPGGPTGLVKSLIGAEVEGFRSLVVVVVEVEGMAGV